MILLFSFLIGVSSLFSQTVTPSCGVILEKGIGAEADLISYSAERNDKGCPVEVRISPLAKGVGGKVYKLVSNPGKEGREKGISVKLFQSTSYGPCFYKLGNTDVTCQRDAFQK